MLVDVEPGSELAGYRIERALAIGGMGTVYLAHDPVLPRMVALKVLSSELAKDPSVRERFTRESDTGARLHHPNIVSIYSRGEAEDGQLWMAMQYVAGIDAEAALAAGTMNPARALRIVREVAKALDYAHRLTVAHHDVKPSNILLSADIDNDDEHVLLSDFGISRTIGQTDSTEAASLALSLAYASPEAITGGAITGSSDIYSLGCTLFRLLSNKHVFSHADGTSALVEAHLRQPPPRISDFLSGSSPQLDSVIAKALAKNPDQRFGTAREFAAAATQALQHAIPRETDTPRRTDPERDSGPAADPRTAHRFPAPPLRPPPASAPRPGSGLWPPADYRQPPPAAPALPPPPPGGPPAPSHQFNHHARQLRIDKARRSRRITLAGAGVAGVVALIALMIYALSSPSTPPSPPPPDAATESTTPPTTPPVTADPREQARLAGLLPRGYQPDSCSPGPVTGATAASTRCGPNTDPGGPTSATYTIARDSAALRKAMDDIVRSATPVVCPPNILSPGPWHRVDNPTAAVGVVFCGTRSGATVIAWTNEPERMLCETQTDADGSTLEQVFDWWASHS